MTKLKDEIEITKMEREMFEVAGFDINVLVLEDDIKVIKDCAEVAKKYIEKAFSQGVDKQHYEPWAKENGIL